MDICIIADDLTGANDAGVQCTYHGYRPSVALKAECIDQFINKEALVIDTDSRALPAEEAYKTVTESIQPLLNHPPNVIYKKIDSTLRGNIGAELDAVAASFSPDFIIVTPAHPSNGRTVVDGKLYVHGKLLTDTNISNHPDHHFDSSRPVDIIREQSKEKARHLSVEEVKSSHLISMLKRCKDEGIVYLSIDSEREEELRTQVEWLAQTGFNLIWAGSAGAAQYLSSIGRLPRYDQKNEIDTTGYQVDSALFVSGSMNAVSEMQREKLKQTGEVETFAIDPVIFFQDGWETHPCIQYILSEVRQQRPSYLLLHPKTRQEDIDRVKIEAQRNNLTMGEAARLMADRIGKLVRYVFDIQTYGALLMTGGDIAKAVCTALDSTEFELHREFERGIPLGTLRGNYEPTAITKAGAFGSENTWIHALHFLKGEVRL
ncbi:four-carbon acid sugar kinase family protein [Salibacterium salarium]|uniref:Four-carbon acid sugar kinase family protein n=1 Tax=Salibacterium salarium TaxID=284579 RepID=A0A428MRP4_9BACI|nr:four-carbon acid sugar kinase family protein [Salibacterium salarium]RSL28797.1 four-carbon acid sugar kinase family protein [Salibacterium salarium]